jgi:energy-converting hydrogenase Eha subunit F
LIAIFGVNLQLAFFGYAAWVTFYYPQLYDGEELPSLWSFCLATTGTLLLVVGITLCALFDRETVYGKEVPRKG